MRSLPAPSGFHFRNCPSGFGFPFRFRFARRAVLRIFSQEPFSGAYFINGSIIQDSSIQFICIAYLRILHTCILACYKLLRHPHYEHHQILNQQLPCDYMTLYFFSFTHILYYYCVSHCEMTPTHSYHSSMFLPQGKLVDHIFFSKCGRVREC